MSKKPSTSKRRRRSSKKKKEAGNFTSSSEDETMSPPAKRVLVPSTALLPARPLGVPSEMNCTQLVNSPPVQIKVEAADIETEDEDSVKIGNSTQSSAVVSVEIKGLQNKNSVQSSVVDSIRNISNSIAQSSPVGSVEIGGLQSTSLHSSPSENLQSRTVNTSIKVKTEKLDPGYNVYAGEAFKTTANPVALEKEQIAHGQPMLTGAVSNQSVISEAKQPNHLQVTIKKELLNENLNTKQLIDIENKHLSPPKSYHTSATENKLLSPPKSFPSHNTDANFSRDNFKYLDLNMYYNLDDIKQCIQHLITKYNLSNSLQAVNSRSIPFIPSEITPPSTPPAKLCVTATPDHKSINNIPNLTKVSLSSPNTSPVPPLKFRIAASPVNKSSIKTNVTDPVFPTVQTAPIHPKPIPNSNLAVSRPLATPVRQAVVVSAATNPISKISPVNHTLQKSFNPTSFVSDSYHAAAIPQNTSVCRPAIPIASLPTPSTFDLQRIITSVKRKCLEQKEESLSPMKILKSDRQIHRSEDERTVPRFNNAARNSTSSSVSLSSSFDSSQRTNSLKPVISVISTEEYRGKPLEIPRDPRMRKNVASTVGALISPNSQIASRRPSTSAREISSRPLSNLDYSSMEGHVSKYVRGTENVPAQDVPFFILEWDAAWLNIQKLSNKYPPIWGQREILGVRNAYETYSHYSNTYYGLHFLNIWLNIYNAFRNNPTYQCQLTDYEEKPHHFKNTCQTIMPFADMPCHQGIILVMYTKANGETHRLFGYVYDVKAKPCAHSSGEGSYRSMKDVIFSFYTSKKIETFINGGITMQKLCRVRVAIRQYAALGLTEFSTTMKKVVLNPMKYPEKIEVVELPSHPLDTHIDKIMHSAMSPENMITLVQRPRSPDTIAILKIVRRSLPLGCTILVCLRDMEKFRNIANTLKELVVLAVKESEVNLTEGLMQYTLRALATSKFPELPLDRAELKVLSTSKIIVTVLSSVFLSDSKTAVLGSDLMCIIDEAHISPEAETALPLSYKPKNVILFGDYNEHSTLHPFLTRLGYHKSLYHRLFK